MRTVLGLMTEQRMKVTGLLTTVVLLAALPPFLPSYWLTILNQMLIFAVLAMSLDLLMGYTGLASFGHCAFFGASAYVVAILSTRYGSSFLVSALCGLLAAIIIGLIFGFLVAHTEGVYFLMITLALGMVIWGLAFRWVTMTGGDNGIAGIPRPDLGLPISFNDPVPFYYFTLVVFLAAFVLLYIFVRSPFGQSLLGIRESESRMRNLGYNTWLHKYLAYAVAGAFSGLSGLLWAYYNGFVSPMDVELTSSFEAFLMVILGGAGTLVGPAFGAGLIVFLKNFISAYTQRWLLILGAIYVLTILYAPGGLAEVVKRITRGRET
jgi:branched-chain amino acid transport system permease protein